MKTRATIADGLRADAIDRTLGPASEIDGEFHREREQIHFVVSKHDGPWEAPHTVSIVAAYVGELGGEAALNEALRRKVLQPNRSFAVAQIIAEARVTQSPVTIVPLSTTKEDAR